MDINLIYQKIKTVNEDALKVFSEQAHKLGLLPNQAEGWLNFIMI